MRGGSQRLRAPRDSPPGASPMLLGAGGSVAAFAIPRPSQTRPAPAAASAGRIPRERTDGRSGARRDGQMDGAEPGGMDRWTEGLSCRAAIQSQLRASGRHGRIAGSSGQPCTAEGAERPPRASESPCPKIPALKMPLRSALGTRGGVQHVPSLAALPGPQELCRERTGCHQAPSPNSP